eukprot:CAMPEP_0177788314 /NCGR_PEP_ID=MMETSP0491_2-20121128/22040_1 /TAXON_ID=63592 /ORGANISM="Tetraselmis chuii, Strain PLY429" /LENGTH=41 /DNA_ID= /DNA_START= /DNA_END= /DNA_ORIENTATION=
MPKSVSDVVGCLVGRQNDQVQHGGLIAATILERWTGDGGQG